jgi:hypothetical protein
MDFIQLHYYRASEAKSYLLYDRYTDLRIIVFV